MGSEGYETFKPKQVPHLPCVCLLAMELGSETFPDHLLSAAWAVQGISSCRWRECLSLPTGTCGSFSRPEWTPARGCLRSLNVELYPNRVPFFFPFGIFELLEYIIVVHVTLFQIFTYSHEICSIKATKQNRLCPNCGHVYYLFLPHFQNAPPFS